MTKSTITRERLEEIRDCCWMDDLGLSMYELSELASMALAAMDSESGCLPLDYLQGHKDGLEWAAKLAEANHPETGDWLYDDPIELAKAIRKGPDMPPVQPVADSEHKRNPVLAYADSYRDMAKQGVESVPIWSVITDLERNIAPLYRHAQPAKTVQPVMFIDGDISSEDADKLAKVIREFNEEDERPLAKMARIIRENPHPINECDMPKGQPAPVSLTETQVAALEEEEKSCHDGIRKCIASLRYHHKRAEAHSTGYKGSTLEDDTLKSINFLKRNIIAAMFRAEPVTTANKLGNSPVQSDCCPAQNQGWIPVSERMPDNTEPVLCIEKRADFGTYGQPFVCWHDGGGWVGKTNYRPIVTHWMPLPAAPQEVK